mmetsp:Transcript_27467/g.5052  ORF Transcript_27467/g.5052 Transcript_27467/m.5052 type:complete len:140 (-) Transcript_27467:458-877(-)
MFSLSLLAKDIQFLGVVEEVDLSNFLSLDDYEAILTFRLFIYCLLFLTKFASYFLVLMKIVAYSNHFLIKICLYYYRFLCSVCCLGTTSTLSYGLNLFKLIHNYTFVKYSIKFLRHSAIPEENLSNTTPTLKLLLSLGA